MKKEDRMELFRSEGRGGWGGGGVGNTLGGGIFKVWGRGVL